MSGYLQSLTVSTHVGGRRIAFLGLLLVISLATGCQTQRPDVAADAARLTGVVGAIQFREVPDMHASMPAPGEVVRLDDVVRLALLHDSRIQASLARVRVAEADADQARLLPNPILAFDVRFPVTDPGTAFEPSLAADLLSLLQKPAQISAADNHLRAAAATALTTVLDVMVETQEAYFAARSADVEIENARDRQQRLAQIRALAQKRLDAGEATRLDVLTIDAQLMQAELSLHDLELVRTQQRLALARMMGDASADVTWVLAEPHAAADSSVPESMWLDAAMLHRPEIAVKIWELRALGDDVEIAKFSPLQGGDIGVHGERDPGWRVGPTLTIPLPIFDLGQATRAKAIAQRTVARHELMQQQQDVIQDVRGAYAAFEHARRALTDSKEKLLPLQSRQTEQAQLSYRVGETELVNLLVAQNDLQLTLSNIVELQEKVMATRAKLQRAAGGAGTAAAVQTAFEVRRPTAVPSTAPTQPNAGENSLASPATTPATGIAQ